MCCLRLNFHTNNVSLDNKVILMTVQNARAFSRLGESKWEERNGRSCVMYVYMALEMYLLKKYLKKLNRLSSQLMAQTTVAGWYCHPISLMWCPFK